MDIEAYLAELKFFFNDILISGVNYMPASVIRNLKVYAESSENYNLFTLSSLIHNFIENDKQRDKLFVDIVIWLDIAIVEYENLSVLE